MNTTSWFRKDSGVFTETFLRSVSPDPVPGRMEIDGTWSLADNHDLKLSLSASDSDHIGRTIIFKGDIIAPSDSKLVFKIRHCDALSGTRSRTIELKGIWATDKNNRLTFKAAKTNGRYDILTFNGTWHIDQKNELSYRITRANLKTKIKVERSIIFRGKWDFFRNRLVYSLETSGASSFSFKAAIQTKSLLAKKGEIRYQLGTELSNVTNAKGFSRQNIIIFGTWKLSRDLKVTFTAKSPKTSKREVSFEIEHLFTENRKIKVSLKDKKGEKMGLDITFNTVFANDAEFFISIGRNAEESRVIGGLKLRF